MGQKPTYEQLERRVRELEQAQGHQQKIEQKLKEGAILLNQSQKIAHLGSFIWNLENDSLTWSKNMYAIHGLSEADFEGNLNEVSRHLIHPEDRDHVRSEIGKMIQAKRVCPMEFRIIRPDGEQRFMRSDGEFEFNEAGKPVKCIGVHQDITEKAEQEQRLKESEEKYRALVEDLNDVIFSVDVDGHITYVSPSVKRGFGYEPSAVIGRSFFEFVDPRDHKALQSAWEDVLNGHFHPSEYRLQKASGDVAWVRVSSRGVWEGGVIKEIRGVLSDITETKQAELALRESETRVRAKLHAVLSPEGDIGRLDLADILDTEGVQRIMDDFYRLTHIGVAVINMKGNVLVATGWQDICTRFHRVHPETRRNCIQSDLELSRGVAPGSFKIYRCKNNMWDMVTPLMVGGKHLGNLFLGQFFFDDEKPDYEVFRSQARQYGFDQAEYLAALDRVPRWSRETVDAVMTFYTKFANLISGMSYSNLKLARSLEQRNQAEMVLRESEETYRNIFQNAQVGLYRTRISDGKLLESNEQMARMFGYNNREQLIAEYITSENYVDPGTRERMLAEIRANGSIRNFEARFYRKDGSVFWARYSARIYPDKGWIEGVAEDITARKQAEEERERLMSAVEQAGEAVVITDSEANIQYVNPAFEQITGYRAIEVKGKNPRILKSGKQDDAFYKDLWKTITSGKTWKDHMINRRKNGSYYTEEASISPVTDDKGDITHFVAVKRDVTEEIETEKKLAQVQKMESIGTLAGGVAHDFNNILSPIMIHSEMAMMELPDDSPLQMSLTQIYQAGERARDLVQQILTFARREEKERIPLRASLIVKEAIKFLRSTIPTTIDIQYDIQAEQDTVLADPSQIHQIVMNLCTNAAHAMREKGG
ncbi:MAG: PAS domain S-box protein, partial [Deltaproteobacteria bacterium]|nr:PAS domain S-box protein [Deltaproteobacteria bacterium]